MKILIIDRFNQKRDMAQMDMYNAISEVHEVKYYTKKTIYQEIEKGDYDYLWLGICHYVIKLNWEKIFTENKKPVIIDNADNEEFLERHLDYSKIENKTFLSRYNSSALSELGQVKLLPWYVNPDRFKPSKKDIDVSFICSIYGTRRGNNRNRLKKKLERICYKRDLTLIAGEIYGNTYRDILSRSKFFVIDGSRLCLTQKYIEASLCECILIGETPKYPDNLLITFPYGYLTGKGNTLAKTAKSFNKDYVLATFADKEYFLSYVESILV